MLTEEGDSLQMTEKWMTKMQMSKEWITVVEYLAHNTYALQSKSILTLF